MDSKQIEGLDLEKKYRSDNEGDSLKSKINVEQSINQFTDSAGKIVDKEIKGVDRHNAWDVISSEDILAIKNPEEQLAAARANLEKIIASFNSSPKISGELLYEKIQLKDDFMNVYKSWNFDEKMITQFVGNYYNFRGSGMARSVSGGAIKILDATLPFSPIPMVTSAYRESFDVQFFDKENVNKFQKSLSDVFYKSGVSTKVLDSLFKKYDILFVPELSSKGKPDDFTMANMYRFYQDIDNLVGGAMKENIAKGVDVSGLTKLREQGLNAMIDYVGYLKSGYTGNYHEQILDMKKRGVKVYSSQLDDK